METPHAASSPPAKYPDQLEGEVAGCRVLLQLDNRSVPWHEELSGTLLLEGGDEARTFSIEVRIEEYPDQVPQGQELLPDRTWGGIVVAPGERECISFALRMPSSVPFRRMRFRALFRSGLRHSTALSAQIHVAPPLPFQRMATPLEELTGVAVRSWNTSDLGDGVVAHFLPDKQGPKPFDALKLELYQNNGIVYGTLVLDPVDRTFADRLRTAAGADRVSFPFRFSEGDLRGVRSFYERSLRPYRDGLRGLPIPATQPEPSADALPLPSGESAVPTEVSERE